jgi:hypothetical protein
MTPGIVSNFGEHLIPLFNVSANNKPFVVFVQLVKIVGNLLTACLNSKIGLPCGNNVLAWVTVLHNQITGVAREFIINNFFGFPDVGKTKVASVFSWF